MNEVDAPVGLDADQVGFLGGDQITRFDGCCRRSRERRCSEQGIARSSRKRTHALADELVEASRDGQATSVGALTRLPELTRDLDRVERVAP